MPRDSEIRERIDYIEDERYCNAFRYQYLIAGRISEVAGKYGPRRTEAHEVDFKGEPAILFVVKTAKREGRLRPVAIPLNPEYEPWAKPVYEFYRNGGEYPFKFAEKWSTSIRYMQWEAEKAFEGMEWPMVGYTVKKGDVSIKIPPRWKGVTSHVMRKRRAVTLLYDYEFSGVDLSILGGWTESSQAEAMPQVLKSYLYLDPTSSTEPLRLLKKMAGRYFYKLCRSVFDEE